MAGFETRTSDLCSWWLHLPKKQRSSEGRSGVGASPLSLEVFGPVGCIIVAHFIAAVVREQDPLYGPQLLQ